MDEDLSRFNCANCGQPHYNHGPEGSGCESFRSSSTQLAKQDTQWDRDAREFTARYMRHVKTPEAARVAAELGAEAADELARQRAKRTH